MGCTVSFKAHNASSRYWTAISRDSQVRIKGGWWKKLGTSVWIGPGQTKHWSYNLSIGCKPSREFRLLVKRFTAYHGSQIGSSYACWPYSNVPDDVFPTDSYLATSRSWRADCTHISFFVQGALDVGDLNRFFQ
jgi:hypothetical protein